MKLKFKKQQYQISGGRQPVRQKVFCQPSPERFVSSVMYGEGVSNDSFDVYCSAVCDELIRLMHSGRWAYVNGFV